MSLSIGHIILRITTITVYAEYWLIGSVFISSYILGFVRYNLEESAPFDKRKSFQDLGLANVITLIRGLFLGLLAGFIFLPRPEGIFVLIPGLLYGASLGGDYLDGYVAKHLNGETALGARLDMELDSLGVLIASLVAYSYGMIPIWVLITVGSARYLFVFGKWMRKKMGKPVFELPDKTSRLIIGDVLRVFLFLAILPLFHSSSSRIAASILAVIFLAGFVRDWLIVIGAIENYD